MPTIKITKKTIDTYKALGQPVILWDTELKGFGVRVYNKDRASYVVKKYLGTGGRGAKQVWTVLGDYSELDPTEARAKALSVMSDVRSGTDLTEQKRRNRQEQLALYASGTFEETVNDYIGKHQEPGRYWEELERLFRVEAIPSIGARTLVVHITKRDLRNLIDRTELRAPGVARFLYAALNPYFKWLVSRDIIPENPMVHVQPPKALKARDRVLSDKEIQAFWVATEARSIRASDEIATTFDPYHAMYRVLLLTGQRREEVCSMDRSELDLDKSLWTIPSSKTKNGKVHLVHVTDQVKALVSGDNRLVFHKNAKGLTGHTQAKERLDKIMKTIIPIDPWRVHDLRRTCASGMARLGVLPNVIERVLNHTSGVSGGLVGVYQRYEYLEERKKALELWSSYVANLCEQR